MATETTNATVAKRPRVTDSTSPDKRDKNYLVTNAPVAERPAHARVKRYSVIYVLFGCKLVARGVK